MAKTKESIQKYNKEYFARPEVIARAKIRNSQPHIKLRRKLYKKTKIGRKKENESRAKNYAKVKDLRRAQRYGIEVADFENMKIAQNNVCAICNGSPDKDKELHVDHCHSTKVVRGLLCGSCNRGLGMFKDNIFNLLKAVDYLKKHN